jgi:hypothetical protein
LLGGPGDALNGFLDPVDFLAQIRHAAGARLCVAQAAVRETLDVLGRRGNRFDAGDQFLDGGGDGRRGLRLTHGGLGHGVDGA